MHTQNIVNEDYQTEQNAVVWLEDLQAAILDAHNWNTPIINTMLMEFVWAGRAYFTCSTPIPYLDISEWLNEEVPGFKPKTFELFQNPRWLRDATDPSKEVLVWTPSPCRGYIPDVPKDICIRCSSSFIDYGKPQEEPLVPDRRLEDPFNLSRSWHRTRAWCKECVEGLNYPWREAGYL